MTQRYVEVTRTSWGKRLGGSIKGIFAGIVLVVIGISLLFWNEGRTVKRSKALTAGAGKVLAIDPRHLEERFEGQLVHASDEIVAHDVLRDPIFGVAAPGLLLEREVEMFQWREHTTRTEETRLGGGTETTTTYEYRTEWSSRSIDSSRFHVPEGHGNPGRFPFEGQQIWAQNVTLGDLHLSPPFIRGLARKQSFRVTEADLEAIEDDALRASLQLDGGEFYLGESPAAPRVGDVRIRFHVAPEGLASVVGEQRGGSMIAHAMPGGQTIALTQMGNVPAEAMFQAAQTSNRIVAWMARGFGFLLLLMGFGSILRPLSVLADVVPMIGNLVGAGTSFVSFVLAAFTSLVTIAVGWLFYRPLLGITLLLAAGALAYWLISTLRQRRVAVAAPVAAPSAAAAGAGAPPSLPPAAAPPPSPSTPGSPGGGGGQMP